MCKIERTGKKEQRKPLFVLKSNTTFRDYLHVFTDKIDWWLANKNVILFSLCLTFGFVFIHIQLKSCNFRILCI